MSSRRRKQQALVLLIAALFLITVSAAAGYASGYGVNSAKRIALEEENTALRQAETEAENEENAKDTEAILEENKVLKEEKLALEEKTSVLEKEKTELSEKVEMLEEIVKSYSSDNGASEELDSEVLTAPERNEIETSAEVRDTVGSKVSLIDKITKYAIIVIIVLLVLMGAGMFLSGRNKDIDEEDEDDDDDEIADDISPLRKMILAKEDGRVDQNTKIIKVETPETKKTPEEAEEETTSEELNYVEEAAGDFCQESTKEEQNDSVKAEETEKTVVPNTLEELMLESIKKENLDD